jgi:hypothetical protein
VLRDSASWSFSTVAAPSDGGDGGDAVDGSDTGDGDSSDPFEGLDTDRVQVCDDSNRCVYANVALPGRVVPAGFTWVVYNVSVTGSFTNGGSSELLRTTSGQCAP